MFRIRPELCVMLVLFSILCMSQFVYSVSSVRSADTETSYLLYGSFQAQSASLDTTSTIRVSISAPEYVLVEKTGEIKLVITNTGASQREIIVKVESTLRYIEVVYPTKDLVLKISPEATHTLDIIVKGVAEGKELLVITIIDLVVNHTNTEVVRLPVTTLRTVYIHAHGVINLFTLEVVRRPIELYSVHLCNVSASHLKGNVYVVEVPKIYKRCELRYEFDFIEDSYEVSLAEDTIYLTTIDTQSNLSITIIAVLLIIPAAIILFAPYAEYTGDLFVFGGMAFAIVAALAMSVPSLFIHLGFGLAILIFDLVVILGKMGFFHLVYYLLVLVTKLIYHSLILFVRVIKRIAVGLRKKTGEGRIFEDVISFSGVSVAEDGHLELINLIKNQRLPSPPKRTHVESVMVPVWLRDSLRKVGEKLPSEMHLIDCGFYSSCVYECGPYAIKLPRILKEILKSSSNTFPTIGMDLATKFEREFSIVSKLDHDNILRLIDYSTSPPIMVYELADGSLQTYRHLEFKDALAVAIQLCEGLKYLHSRGIVHGDIKPSNILVVKGVVKLGDLSSITHLLSVSSEDARAYCTPGYCAPEQRFSDIRFDERGKGYENRVDIYQLANVILYMLGIEPVDAKDLSYAELDKRLKNVEISELRSLLRDMLSPYPWQRPSIEEVEKRLLCTWKKYIKGDMDKKRNSFNAASQPES